MLSHWFWILHDSIIHTEVKEPIPKAASFSTENHYRAFQRYWNPLPGSFLDLSILSTLSGNLFREGNEGSSMSKNEVILDKYTKHSYLGFLLAHCVFSVHEHKLQGSVYRHPYSKVL